MSASDKQRALADSLYRERVIPDEVWDRLQTSMNNRLLSPRTISQEFDQIIKANYPRRARAAGGGVEMPDYPDWSERQPASYAVPAEGLSEECRTRLVTEGQRFLFFEVTEWKGRWRCRKLTGSSGAFKRSTIWAVDQQELWRLLGIEGMELKLTKLFGQIFACCGVCKAPLTDDLSRELHIGPDCRRLRFGL